MTKYYADQIDGRPEDDLSAKWSVLESDTGKVVASWRETPITGLTQQEAEETADAWNRMPRP